MNAIAEFEEVKERYDFYNEQITDLVEAKGKLEETIAEIDKEVKERFLTTFVQVAENFNKIFKELFKGGYADMTLESPNDILNTGIVIEASPPGKKTSKPFVIIRWREIFNCNKFIICDITG